MTMDVWVSGLTFCINSDSHENGRGSECPECCEIATAAGPHKESGAWNLPVAQGNNSRSLAASATMTC